MTLNLMMVVTIFSCLVLIFILYLVKKDKIKVKYAVLWLLLFGVLLMFLLIPGLLNLITYLLGFEMASNMIFSLLIGVLVLISISLTGVVSSQDRKIRILIQEVSLLKNELDTKK